MTLCFGSASLFAGSGASWVDGVTVGFGEKHGQVEVGGPYAGAEFHDSRPLPCRISFYYPVANSIDLSTDYWRRNESRPMVVGVKLDDTPGRWLGKEAWEYTVSPHRVTFVRIEANIRYRMQYEFCLNEPGCIVTISVRNDDSIRHALELYTHLKLALRTCQTYARFEKASTNFDTTRRVLVAQFSEPQTGLAAIMVQNVGAQPESWTSSADEIAAVDSGGSSWVTSAQVLRHTLFGRNARGNAAAAFLYRKLIEPGDSLTVIQFIGSTRQREVFKLAERTLIHWSDEVRSYDELIRSTALGGVPVKTGDAWIDSSAAYASAILGANQHYLDGAVVPMPCPAEYNFFFTHDVLLTDLAAVNFDLARVKRDLLYIARHAKNHVIPHAYYWRDNGFKTEYCTPGNWNHLWFILATAAYLRHSLDTNTARRLSPLLTKSLEETLRQRRGAVMQGPQPDWWDFGHVQGARSYLTILTIRALEEYLFVSARLHRNLSQLQGYERLVDTLRSGLLQTLWDEHSGYLLNFNGTTQDRHIYMGPLIGAALGVLPPGHRRRLVDTARRYLLDDAIGIRTVSPADFHVDSVKSFYKVAGNEAGDQYLYANGGVWYLGNAWFAWALQSSGDADGSLEFFRRTMTIDGIIRSPRGEPALYEYRYADRTAGDFGWIDKPTMMWSGGLYLETVYRLIGIEENPWNISIAGLTPSSLKQVTCRLSFGGQKNVERSGEGYRLTRMLVDSREVPSRVLPLDASRARTIKVIQGPIRYPYVDSVTAILQTASFDLQSKRMSLQTTSYEGHHTAVNIITPWMSRAVFVNGKPWKDFHFSSDPKGVLILTISFRASAIKDRIDIEF